MIVRRNTTVHEVSKKAGLSSSTVYGLYRRNAVPRVMTLIKLCWALDIRLSEFLRDIEDIQNEI